MSRRTIPSMASMLRSADGVVELARVDISYPSFVPKTNAAVDASGRISNLRMRCLRVSRPRSRPAGSDGLPEGDPGGNGSHTLVTSSRVAVLLLIYRAPLAALFR